MNFTLDYLRSIDACEPARRAFASRFGADGTATAQDVFRALADLQRVDWLEWLCNAAPGFPYAVGNCEAENGWQCVTAGEHLAQVGIFCVASDNATVRATGNATVQAYGNATVQAYGNATVLTQYFASGVKTILHSDMACWIDRRDGALKVITAAMQEQSA